MSAALMVVAATAACGGGRSSAVGFDEPSPAGPSSSSAPPPSLTPSAAPTRAQKKEQYAFPADFKVRFPAYTGEGEEAIRAYTDFWSSWWYAVTTQGQDKRYQARLSSGDMLNGGLTVFSEVVQSWRNERVRPTGVLRVHQLNVTSAEGQKVAFTACVDASKVGTKSVSSGAERWTLGKRKTSRYQMRILMGRSAGTWKVNAFLSDSTVKECR